MINRNFKLLIIILMATAVGMAGCMKCYNCKTLSAAFAFYKPTDTVYVIALTGKRASDSILFYKNLGYLCDTIDWIYAPRLYYTPVCGQDGYNRAMYNQDICEPEK
jgi:hypothetical protein